MNLSYRSSMLALGLAVLITRPVYAQAMAPTINLGATAVKQTKNRVKWDFDVTANSFLIDEMRLDIVPDKKSASGRGFSRRFEDVEPDEMGLVNETGTSVKLPKGDYELVLTVKFHSVTDPTKKTTWNNKPLRVDGDGAINLLAFGSITHTAKYTKGYTIFGVEFPATLKIDGTYSSPPLLGLQSKKMKITLLSPGGSKSQVVEVGNGPSVSHTFNINAIGTYGYFIEASVQDPMPVVQNKGKVFSKAAGHDVRDLR